MPSERYIRRQFGEKVRRKMDSSNGTPIFLQIAPSVSKRAWIESTMVPSQSKRMARMTAHPTVLRRVKSVLPGQRLHGRLVLRFGQPNTPPGSATSAESAASAADPPYLIWAIPAKEAGTTTPSPHSPRSAATLSFEVDQCTGLV